MVLEVKKPRPLWEIIFSTHHTDIGLLYIIFSITFLLAGGALALAIRTELFLPGQQIIPDPNTFHRFFTVHGTTMLFLWAIPFAAGVGNYLIPILVRYKDMAWPKLNAVAFWMIPVGAGMVWLGFADLGWTAYPPYSIIRAPGPAAELWIFGLKILGLSSILGSINFIVTILRCKHPDLPIMKMSLFAWSILAISLMQLVAIPTFAFWFLVVMLSANRNMQLPKFALRLINKFLSKERSDRIINSTNIALADLCKMSRENFTSFHSVKVLSVGMAITFVAFAFQGISFLVLADSVGQHVGFFKSFMATSASTALSTLPITIGGSGLAELGVWAYITNISTIPNLTDVLNSSQLSVIIAWRIATYHVPLVIMWIALMRITIGKDSIANQIKSKNLDSG